MDRAGDAVTSALGAGGEAATLAEFLGYKRDAVIGKALDMPDSAAHRGPCSATRYPSTARSSPVNIRLKRPRAERSWAVRTWYGGEARLLLCQ
jgi:hypothetical protein